MGTTTLLVLRDRLAKMVEGSDYFEVDVTANINADNSIVSTNLQSYDHGSDGYFDSWWVYITTFDNAGTFRRIPDYDTVTGTISIRGASLNDDTDDTATIRLTRIDPTLYLNALNDAVRDIYPNIVRYFDDLQLITGNILPPFNWTSASTFNQYTKPAGTLLKNTTGGTFRNGPTSAKVTGSDANDGIVLDSNSYPRLLDIKGKTVGLYCWVYPQDANGAFLDIITTDGDGNDTTVSSTTTCPAVVFTLLKKEGYSVPNGTTRIKIKLRVLGDGKYVYFDPPRLIGRGNVEYMIPLDYAGGAVRSVEIQYGGDTEFVCDELHPTRFMDTGFSTFDDGTDVFLRLPVRHENSNRIRIKGDYPMTVLSDDDDTIPTNELKPLNLFLKYAQYKLFESLTAAPDSQDITRYERAAAKALGEYYRMLPMARMSRTPSLLNIRRY